MDSFFIFLLGLALGLKHAFDADHIVAINTLLSKTKNLYSAINLGFFWGTGHTITLFFVGLLVFSLNISIPARLALFLEFLVGIMLIVLGVGSMHKKLESNLSKIKSSSKSLGIGMIHGLAGSAALMLLLITQIKSEITALLYIIIFGLGSILGMLITSVIIYKGINFFKIKDSYLVKNIAGTLSIIVGITLIIEIGFVEGLFLI